MAIRSATVTLLTLACLRDRRPPPQERRVVGAVTAWGRPGAALVKPAGEVDYGPATGGLREREDPGTPYARKRTMGDANEQRARQPNPVRRQPERFWRGHRAPSRSGGRERSAGDRDRGRS